MIATAASAWRMDPILGRRPDRLARPGLVGGHDVGCREADLGSRPAFRPRTQRGPAAPALRQRLDDREAEACPRGTRLPCAPAGEPLEHGLLFARVDPRAFVEHGE